MNGYGTILDGHAILLLEATRDASREQALKYRDLLRQQLRLLEEMHNLPFSFKTKTELEREQFYERQSR